MGSTEELMKAVLEGDEEQAERATRRGLDEGIDPVELLEKGAVAGIYKAGRLWQDGEYFLPDIVLATEAYKVAMERLDPLLSRLPGRTKGRVVIGSVEGDAHDLGKNIVTAMLRCASYDVVDLGVDVPGARFVEAAREGAADVVGMGAYMTTTMRRMEEVVADLEAAGLRDSVKVIVGGAAVTGEYAEKIGADGCADNAADAVLLVDRLLGVG
jgi:corrinoid protein of di/trimethylamine methyltransferase